MQSHGKDIKGRTISKFCLAGTLTAAGTGDNTLITGDSINIAALAARPASVVFEIAGRAVLAATKTLTIAALIEASVDGSIWTTLVASATVLTLTSTGGGTEFGVGRIGVDLIQADLNYIRLKATPDLSNTATDTAIVCGVAVFGAMAKT